MLNHVALMGRVLREPKIKSSSTGSPYCSFVIAIPVPTKIGNPVNPSKIVPCIAFGDTAKNFVKFVSKGELVAIEGTLDVGDWYYEDKGGEISRIKNDVYVIAKHISYLNWNKKFWEYKKEKKQ